MLYINYLSEKKEYVLSKQLLRCGTSIGANIREEMAGESKKDFILKLGIALKEARETSDWLKLLKDRNYIDQERFFGLGRQCDELTRIFNSNILTTKDRYLKS